MRDELVRAITADGLVKAVACAGGRVERAGDPHSAAYGHRALGRTLLAPP